ncbi:hypothetical protein DXG03_009194 [Asterophora parasitica]|uniref:PWWP domain-containing protein n=1 Tax=Asterophora parasitica TaxID=117018 RepID=A0A9P7G4P5_9AGAR|nr:hypothetical protein DXG03_009194 [Asterophora parasitica]
MTVTTRPRPRPLRRQKPPPSPPTIDIPVLKSVIIDITDSEEEGGRGREAEESDLSPLTPSPVDTRAASKFPEIKSASCTAHPLKVQLFGNETPGRTIVEIDTPSQNNIVSLEDLHRRIRFRTPTFVTLSPDADPHASPRKKHKYDRKEYEDRWRDAVDRLAKDRKGFDEDEDDDELPEVGTTDFALYVTSAPSPTKSVATPRKGEKGTGNGKRKRRDTDSEDDDDNDKERSRSYLRWSPPPPDELLQIPGELLLAKDKASASHYWPGQILAYIPPKNARQAPKYRVHFLDGAEIDIPRDWFFTSEDSGFATCIIGEWQSDFKEVQNDDDDDNGDDMPHMKDVRVRPPSPIPLDPPPSSDEFSTLSIREKLAYVKPVLIAILNENYAPALTRHKNFIAGGSKRKNVVDDAGLRGQMDPRDVNALQQCLSEWCLRDERRADAIVDDAEPESQINGNDNLDEFLARRSVSPAGSAATLPLSQGDQPPETSFAPSEMLDVELTSSFSDLSDTVPDSSTPADPENPFDPPPRQRGSEAYEGLSKVEKIDYCLNVLLPEAIMQVLLWTCGERRSVALLSDEHEEDLHMKGEIKLRERDWVTDVTRLRESCARKLARGNTLNGFAGSGSQDGEVYSAAGRLKRGVRVPKSYRE